MHKRTDLQGYKENKNINNNSNNDIDTTNLIINNKIKKREKNKEKRKYYKNNYSFNRNNDSNFISNENNRNNAIINTNNIIPINNIIEMPINKNKRLDTINIHLINESNNFTQKNSLIKAKKHISFNLNNNIFIKFKKDDYITKSEIINQNGQIYNELKRNIKLYEKDFKLKRPKPIIKPFLPKDIKINKDYILVENLAERQILPGLYDDFEVDDLKSLEKSLEGTVDKVLH